jgi:hypothetical protein
MNKMDQGGGNASSPMGITAELRIFSTFLPIYVWVNSYQNSSRIMIKVIHPYAGCYTLALAVFVSMVW